jgi:hypothetical protein
VPATKTGRAEHASTDQSGPGVVNAFHSRQNIVENGRVIVEFQQRSLLDILARWKVYRAEV